MTSPTDPRARAFDALIQTRIQDGFSHLDPVEPAATPTAAAAVDIVIPVHDAHDAFIACLESVLACTDSRHRLILVDDASTDPRIWQRIRSAANSRPNVEAIHHAHNLGYLRTVNHAITQSQRDVVLLNSDTVVGPQWLDRLAAACHDDERSGMACPLSDNATLLSVISAQEIDGLDAAELQRRVVASARSRRPRLPVAVGFCLYVRRAVFDAIGVFDAAFDPGYGEESDFSMRALAAGFEIVVANDVLVRHRSGSSFGDGAEIERRRQLHARIVEQRWPQYDALIQAWWSDWPLREQAERLRRACASGRPRVLQIAHGLQRLGGIELHSRALVASLAREVDIDLIATEILPDWADARELERGPGWTIRAVNRRLQRPNQTVFGVAADLSDPALERHFLRSLIGGGYRVLHVHSLLRWNSLMLPLLAKAAGVRVLVSLHDLSSLCPNYLMLPKDAPRSCGKSHAGVDAGCVACLEPYRATHAMAAQPDPHVYLAARWHIWRRVLEAADAIVAPSHYLVEKLAASFGSVVADRAIVMPHGLAKPPQAKVRPSGQPLRIGFLFGENRGKGAARVLAIAQALVDTSMCFVIHAIHDRRALPANLPSNIQLHGPFPPESLDDVLGDLDLVLMPTVVGETFSLALSECRAAGVPVLASRDGAFIERIDDGVDGWLLPIDGEADWVALLRHLDGATGRDELRRVAAACAAAPVLHMDDSADRYLALYRTLFAQQRSAGLPNVATLPRDLASLRLAQSVLDGALVTPPRRRDDASLDAEVIDDPGVRLLVSVLVQPHNRMLLATTLESLHALGAGCRIELLDEQPAAALPPPDRHGWRLMLDAGDRVHPDLLRWLSRYLDVDCDAICSDFDWVDADGRHYAAVGQLAWDPWRALVDGTPGQALLVRDPLWQQLGGWSTERLAARHAMQWALAAGNVDVAVLGRVLVHAADINRSPGLREAAWRAQVAQLGRYLDGERWSVHASRGLPGWICVPRSMTGARVLIVIWSARGVGDDELAAWRSTFKAMDINVIAAKPGLRLPDCDVVGFWRSDVDAISRDALAHLLAWLQQPGIAAVAPRRCAGSGGARSPGIGIDRAAPGWLDPEGGALNGSCRMPALSTACLLVRRDLLMDADVDTLAALDSVASVAVQLRWQQQAHWSLLLVADVAARQALADVAIAAGTSADATALTEAWKQLPLRRRQALCSRPAKRAGNSLAGVPKRGVRVAALTRDDWASSQYRVHQPLRDLHGQGLIDKPLLWRLRDESGPGLRQLEVEQPDLLIAHHAFDDASLQLLEQVSRELRIPIIAVVDDLIDAVPESNPMRSRMPRDIQRRLARVLDLCSCLVVTSTALADAYGKLAWRCVTIENALPLERWSNLALPPATSSERLRVGWAGAQQHQQDLALIDGLVRSRPDLQWVFMGMAPPAATAVGAEVHPMGDFEDYPERLAALRLDIAVVPLVDEPFNRAKSALKLFEFGALGVPVVASDVTPYRNSPARRVGNDLAGWCTMLDRLTQDAGQRRQAGIELQQWVVREHGQAHRRAAWCNALSIPCSSGDRANIPS